MEYSSGEMLDKDGNAKNVAQDLADKTGVQPIRINDPKTTNDIQLWNYTGSVWKLVYDSSVSYLKLSGGTMSGLLNANGGIKVNGNSVCVKKSATVSIETYSSWTVSSVAGYEIAPSIFFVRFVLSCSSAISTSTKPFDKSGFKINGGTPVNGSVLAGGNFDKGLSVNLSRNSNGNWYVFPSTGTFPANDKLYFAGIITT